MNLILRGALAFTLIILFFGFSNSIKAQPSESQAAPNVYLDCSGFCFSSYIRTNIEFVNYVRDQSDADIYLRITNASTGSGREYTMDFRGLEPFSTQRNTLTYHSLNLDSRDERRSGLVRQIKLGLVSFLVDTDIGNDLNVVYDPAEDSQQQIDADDPWNSWVFNIRLGSSMDVEETEFNFDLDGRISAERITPRWKIETRLRVRPNRRTIELSEGTERVNRDRADYRASVVYSIGEHFAIGAFTRYDYSRRENTIHEIQASPAIEYSVFPYSDFQERRIFIQYRVTPSFRQYDEITIFEQQSETIFQQVLSTHVRYDQPWGRIDIRMSGSHFFHDTSLNRFTLNPSFNIRLTRNLSLNISGTYESINDQIALPAGDPDDIDVLLGQREQATSYEFGFSVGLSYTFGSIYSGTVNPRL